MSLRIDVDHTLGAFRLSVAVAIDDGLALLTGPSGAGKTSLLNIIAGMTRPDRGVVAIDDDVLVDTARRIWQPAHVRRIGYMFQTPRLFPHLDVRANLLYGAPAAPVRDHAPAFDDIVKMLALGDLLKRAPAKLSGGEAQRVALGRALLSQPRLLLLDEPLTSVDQARRDEVLPYLDRVRHEYAVPIIYVTHAPADLAARSTQVVTLVDGRVMPAGVAP